MTSSERYVKAIEHIRELKQENRSADVTQFLLSEIQNCTHLEDKLLLMEELATEYQFHDNFTNAEECIRKCIELDAVSPYHWISLAEHFHYYNVDLVRAMSAIEVAIGRAIASGDFVRQAHGVRIRIGLEMKNLEAVTDSLKALIEYEPRQGCTDVGLEKDFIKRIEALGVAPDLARQYAIKAGSS